MSESSRDYPFYCSQVSNTLGYTWKTISIDSSGAVDGDADQGALCYADVPVTTSATDTINIPVQPPSSGGIFNVYYLVRYSGIGSPDTGFSRMSSVGTGGIYGLGVAPAGALGQVGPYATTPGNLCVGFGAGAPMLPVAPGWTEDLEDLALRPYLQVVSSVATTGACTYTWSTSFEDGWSGTGMSFKPTYNSAYHGQSLQVGANYAYNASVPAQATNRVEFSISDIDTSGPTYGNYIHILPTGGATGWIGYYTVNSATSVSLILYNANVTAPSNNLCPSSISYDVGGLHRQAHVVRLQIDPVNKLREIELWDSEGNLLFSNACPFTSVTTPSTGAQIGQGGEARSLNVGFYRVSNTLVPMNSRPPSTVDDANRVFEWKFDGTLADASGNGYNATASILPCSGAPCYFNTPYQDVVASIRTGNWNALINTPTQRAGHPFTLDGTQSVTQNDTSNAVTCQWAQISGPSNLIIANPKTCSTSVTGTITGDYQIQLTATDTGGVSNVQLADIGVVAMDNHNVVVNANTLVNTVFGDMIGWGSNPWLYADAWNQQAFTQRGGGLSVSSRLQNITANIPACNAPSLQLLVSIA